MTYDKISPPTTGAKITFQNGEPQVPDNPIMETGRALISGPPPNEFLTQQSKKPTVASAKLVGLRCLWAMKPVTPMAPTNTYQTIR